MKLASLLGKRKFDGIFRNSHFRVTWRKLPILSDKDANMSVSFEKIYYEEPELIYSKVTTVNISTLL